MSHQAKDSTLTTTTPTTEAGPRRGRRGIELEHLNWPVVIGIAGIHVLGLLAFVPQFFSWSGVGIMLLLIWMTGGLGITLCYHRLLTHRSFKTPKWFEYLLTSLACMAWQGGPVDWVGTHRIHHKHSDEPDDPHSPSQDGFAWAHVFWCMHRQTDGMRAEDAAKDLLRDPGQRWLNRFFYLPQFGLVGLLYLLGWWAGGHALAWSWIVWGVGLRTVLVYHGTWFVNSATHTWGYRNFETKDQSTNLWWVALVSFGEGWHNNHHAHQRSAAHGLKWYELDMTYWTIRLLGKIGLARDIVLPDPEQMPE
jgi:stearoyl-CoA desaturase (delta-9 desaturase)